MKILEGENSFLSKQRLDSLILEYSEKFPNISVKIFDASSSKIPDVVNEYQTQDMFNTHKLLVVKRLLANKSYKDFLDILDLKNQDTELIIWEEKNIPKNTNYYKNFHAEKVIESFSKFNKRSFLTWANAQVGEKGLTANKDVLLSLAEFVNYDPHVFLNELEKILLSGDTQIKQEYIDKNILDTHTNTIWEFLDAVNSKKKTSINILLNLLDNGLDPHYLIVMIARNVKQILLVKKMLDEGLENQEMVKILKIPPFTLPALKTIAKGSDEGKLISIYEKIYNLDYETKIGNIEPELGLILLTTRL